jgi:hypothetical protein
MGYKIIYTGEKAKLQKHYDDKGRCLKLVKSGAFIKV